jgi:hypothetical protein
VKEVGAGQFGAVWLARMETENGVLDCAVKMLKDIKSDADRDDFVHEAEVMLETVSGSPLVPLIRGDKARTRTYWDMVHDTLCYAECVLLCWVHASKCEIAKCEIPICEFLKCETTHFRDLARLHAGTRAYTYAV